MDIFKFYFLFMINTKNTHIFQKVGLFEFKICTVVLNNNENR